MFAFILSMTLGIYGNRRNSALFKTVWHSETSDALNTVI